MIWWFDDLMVQVESASFSCRPVSSCPASSYRATGPRRGNWWLTTSSSAPSSSSPWSRSPSSSATPNPSTASKSTSPRWRSTKGNISCPLPPSTSLYLPLPPSTSIPAWITFIINDNLICWTLATRCSASTAIRTATASRIVSSRCAPRTGPWTSSRLATPVAKSKTPLKTTLP